MLFTMLLLHTTGYAHLHPEVFVACAALATTMVLVAVALWES